MNKNYVSMALTVLCFLGLTACRSNSGTSDGYTLLVIPAQFSTVQLGHDLAQREALLAITYQPGATAGDAFLHAWSGTRWERVPDSRFTAGDFTRTPPGRTVVVGGDNELTARLITDASLWCDEVLNVSSADTADLVNEIGRMLVFDNKEWEWYAARYQLKLEDMNAERRKSSWYKQGGQNVTPSAPSGTTEVLPLDGDHSFSIEP